MGALSNTPRVGWPCLSVSSVAAIEIGQRTSKYDGLVETQDGRTDSRRIGELPRRLLPIRFRKSSNRKQISAKCLI